MATDAATFLTRALDAAVAPPHDATSERILDAALEEAARSGMGNVTMDGIARRGRVGRMTVYRRFGDREGVLAALNVRETRRCLAALDAATDPSQPIADQVAEGFVTSLRLIAEHPLLSRLAHAEPEVLLDALNARRGGTAKIAMRFLAARLRQSQAAGALDLDVDVEVGAELLVRMVLSFLLVPGSRLPLGDDDRLRAIARTRLVPLLSADG